MNILVIGNGFDLAHELPTTYKDFLEFVQVYEEYYKTGIAESKEKSVDSDIKKYIVALFGLRYNDSDPLKDSENNPRREKAKELIEELHNLIKDNFWIDYFLHCNMHGNENWIDFESEISKVIQSLDNDMFGLSDYGSIDDDIMNLSNKFLRAKYIKYTSTVRTINALTDGTIEKITFKEIRNRLLTDLNKLIRAFEIYLTEYVEKIKIQKKSPNIEKVEVDHVLSFNYTNTYEKIYGNTKEIIYDYIHGKAEINNNMEFNNMVLGIDEYLPEDRRNKDVEFIAFKKFYQRIHKQTGCKYKNWVDEIKEDYSYYLKRQSEAEKREYMYAEDDMQRLMNRLGASAIKDEKCKKHSLYIFGHSLDVTDKDILRDLILNDNIYTTIFYHDKDAMGQQIANLVKVIGQDELIRRTGGSTRTIEFKEQQKMKEIEGAQNLAADYR